MDDFKPEAWVVGSTAATSISLVDTAEGKMASFKPAFTYPIFGEAEQVFGYKDLEIILAYDSRNLTPFLNVKYSEKLDDDLLLEKAKMDAHSEETYYDDEEEEYDGGENDGVSGDDNKDVSGDENGNEDVSGDDDKYVSGDENEDESGDDEPEQPVVFDPLQKMLAFLPEKSLVVKDELKWTESCAKDENLVRNILEKDGHVIGGCEKTVVYKINISKFKEIHDRLKIFALFFIEGASYIQDDDHVWDVYIILEKETFKVIGYATCYKYWFYEGGYSQFDALDHVPDDYSYKGRISQFLIFPTFQNQSYGSKLYNTIYDHWLKEPSIKEVNIEDPNESFDALRDKNDFQRLIKAEVETRVPVQRFKTLKESKSDLEKEYNDILNKMIKEFKFNYKQAQRLLEMLFIYLNLDDFIRLIIIKRIYKQNYELLLDFDKEDRDEKLEETYESVKQEYFERIPSLIQKDDFDQPPAKKAKL